MRAVGVALAFNDWVKDPEPEMKTEKGLSERQLHPESGLLLRVGTQDHVNSAPARRHYRQHSADSSGRLPGRLYRRENEEALPGPRELHPRASLFVCYFIMHIV